MGVALYDEDMNPVIELQMWRQSTSTNTYEMRYLPAGGSWHQVAVGSSYTRTQRIFFENNKVWYEDGGDQELGVVDTSSGDDETVIAYIVVTGERFSDAPLADFRLHDIGIQIDLSAVQLEEVECDGTSEGKYSASEISTADQVITNSINQFTYSGWSFTP